MCNQHKELEIAIHGCLVCASNHKRNKDKETTELEKSLQELLG